MGLEQSANASLFSNVFESAITAGELGFPAETPYIDMEVRERKAFEAFTLKRAQCLWANPNLNIERYLEKVRADCAKFVTDCLIGDLMNDAVIREQISVMCLEISSLEVTRPNSANASDPAQAASPEAKHGA